MGHGLRPPLAKLTAPRLPKVLHRKRLFQTLDQCRKRPILWISGPPGAGKTTLVASYLGARKLNWLWYQIDERDEDVGSFFHYLGIAGKSLSRSRQALPRMGPEHRANLSRYSRLFFEKLYQRAKPPFLLVFDNYHEISSESPLHELIACGLSVIPEGANVALLSREFSPSPSLSAFQVRRNLAHLAPEALRLTSAEACAMARLYETGHNLRSRREVEQMHRRLQGWTAGMVLLLENASPDRATAPVSIEETWDVVFEYLAREVIQRQPPETRRFLTHTAFLPAMTASMAEELTGFSSAGQFLAAQNRNRFFIERRESEDPVYQYHSLFRQFLIRQVHRELSAHERRELQTRTAACLEKAGQLEDAMSLLRGVSDVEGQIHMIRAHAAAVLDQGRLQTLEDWIRAIPTERLLQEPWLLYWLASCRLLVSPEESESFFEKAFELFSEDNNREGTLLAWCGILDSILFAWRDLSRMKPWLERVPELLDGDHPPLAPELEARVASTVFTSMMWIQLDDPRIRNWGLRALHQLRTTSHLELVASTGHFLTAYFLWLGEGDRRAEVVSVLRDRLRGPGVSAIARIHLCLAEALHALANGEPEESLCAVSTGTKIAKKSGIVILDALLNAMTVYPLLYGGNLAAAEKVLAGLAPQVEGRRSFLTGVYLLQASWTAFLRSDIDRGWRHVETALKDFGNIVGGFGEAWLRLGAALFLFERGERSRAMVELAEVEEFARRAKSLLLQFTCEACRSTFAFAEGDDDAGIRALETALATAREGGFVDTIWWHPQRMAQLCATALRENIETDFVYELIQRRRLVPPPNAPESWPWLIKVRVLGAFEVSVENEQLRFTGKTQRRPLSLLKAIIALGGRRVPVYRLTDALWSDTDGDLAQQSLAVALHRLRKLLRHPEAVVVNNGEVTLDPSICWVDAWEFQSLAERSTWTPEPKQITKLAERATRLYRGPFLPHDLHEPWSQAARERMQRSWIRLTASLDWERSLGSAGAG